MLPIPTIRSLQLSDIPSIIALSQQLGYNVQPTLLQQQISAILAHQDHQAFVAVIEGEVIGYIHGFKAIRLTTSPFFEICGLVVAEDKRRMGIGKMLVEQIEKHSLGCSKVRVRCNRLRASAHQFYRKLSYLERKEQKVFEKTVPS